MKSPNNEPAGIVPAGSLRFQHRRLDMRTTAHGKSEPRVARRLISISGSISGIAVLVRNQVRQETREKESPMYAALFKLLVWGRVVNWFKKQREVWTRRWQLWRSKEES